MCIRDRFIISFFNSSLFLFFLQFHFFLPFFLAVKLLLIVSIPSFLRSLPSFLSPQRGMGRGGRLKPRDSRNRKRRLVPVLHRTVGEGGRREAGRHRHVGDRGGHGHGQRFDLMDTGRGLMASWEGIVGSRTARCPLTLSPLLQLLPHTIST